MSIQLFQVDAFASEVFRGNPAAVCPLDAFLPDDVLQAIAAENNLSETAFFVPTGDRYHLRWFTPTAEVDLCGHATLATAYVITNELNVGPGRVVFDSRSGELTVEVDGDRLVLDFPSRPAERIDTPAELVAALDREPAEVHRGPGGLMAVFGAESDVRDLSPDFGKLRALKNCVIATAPGDRVDFVSRFFAPFYGIDEDPVTGSAHCTLSPYWAARLDKDQLSARQISKRGGELSCTYLGDRTLIAGRAVLYMRGEIEV